MGRHSWFCCAEGRLLRVWRVDFLSVEDVDDSVEVVGAVDGFLSGESLDEEGLSVSDAAADLVGLGLGIVQGFGRIGFTFSFHFVH
jgi:hypothetical protein